MSARFTQNDLDGVETHAPRSQRLARLMRVFGRQGLDLARPHVWWIADDDIVGLSPERAEMVGNHEANTPAEPMPTHVRARHRERFGQDVHRIDTRFRKSLRACDGDAARAGADVENPLHPARVDPRREALLD